MREVCIFGNKCHPGLEKLLTIVRIFTDNQQILEGKKNNEEGEKLKDEEITK